MVDSFMRWNPIERVGETENFYVDVDFKQKTLLVHEKNIVAECPFRLSFALNDLGEVIEIMERGLRLLQGELAAGEV
jgi:hypothetical protein